MTIEQEDYNKYQEEKEEYQAEMIAEARVEAQAEEQEAEAQYEHEKEVQENPLRIIIEAIIEREEKGQLSPQTMGDLKLLLNAYNVSERL